MEPVSAVASIVGIISFAGIALKAINDLKELCREFSQDATQDFLHDLEVTANVLTDVQTLSKKARRTSTSLHIEYRAEALNIQVDDCARDLTKWLEIALRMRKERGQRKQTMKLQFFNSVLAAISKSSRASAGERLRRHQENINTTLSLFGMHLNLANSSTLHSVDTIVRKISHRLSDNAEDLSKQISSLSGSVSSSADSLQAQQSTICDKLDSMTDLLQQVILSNQSQKGSIKSSNKSESSNIFESTTAGSEKYNVNADNSYEQDDVVILSNPKHQNTNLTAISDTYLGHPTEFDTLFRATNSLINSFHQIYHPLIAEFLSTKHAFDTLEFHLRCLQMGSFEDTWPSAYEREAGLQEVVQKERAAALQLLSLRKQCVFEGLGDTLKLVMSEMGVSEYDFKLWESLTVEKPRIQGQLQLEESRGLNPDEQRKDRLTRTNEWMLGVFNASSYLIDLHQQIMTLEIDRRRLITALIKNKLGESPSSVGIDYWEGPYGTTYETMRRAIVKFWFLDSAAMSEEEYPSSHVANSDSDATFRVLEEKDQSLEDVVKVHWRDKLRFLDVEAMSEELASSHVTGSGSDTIFQRLEVEDESLDNLIQAHGVEPSTTISRDTAPVINLLSDHTREVDRDGIRQVLSKEGMTHDLPPDGISDKLLAAAEEAVIVYRQEPPAALRKHHTR